METLFGKCRKKNQKRQGCHHFHRLNKQEQHVTNNSVNHYYERAPKTTKPDVPRSLSVPRLCNNIVDANKRMKCSLILIWPIFITIYPLVWVFQFKCSSSHSHEAAGIQQPCLRSKKLSGTDAGWAVLAGACVWNIPGCSVVASTEIPLDKIIILTIDW